MLKPEECVADRVERALKIESSQENGEVNQDEVKRILIKRWYETKTEAIVRYLKAMD